MGDIYARMLFVVPHPSSKNVEMRNIGTQIPHLPLTLTLTL
jgi:hypothetical protein